MQIRNLRSQVVAAVLITILPLALAPAFTATGEGTLHGIVVEAAQHAPLAGIKVHVANPGTGVIRVSPTTGNDGAFTVAGLPAATYEIGLEKGGRLFLVRTPVSLAPGQSRSLAVSLNQDTEPEQNADTKATVWQNPLTAALLVTGGAVLLGVILENATQDSRNVSPIAAASTE